VIRLAWPDVGPDEAAAVAAVLETGQLTMGPLVEQFEVELARACEVPHAVAVSSGTAALHLAVLALGLGPGDEVIVPAYTFPATANAVALAGARPVLCDVDPETMNLDVERAAAAVTARTRAVLAVHLFGRPLPWDPLVEAMPERVALLEDAAGALGARSGGRACGSLGVAGCLSFHPRKVVTTGEGGAVVTVDEDMAAIVRRLRHHGIALPGRDIPAPGFNYRLADVLCAIGIGQVRRLDELIRRRRELAAGYAQRLAGIEGILLPAADPGDEHGWQAYVIQLDGAERALTDLRARGIEAQRGTYAVHHTAAYRDQGPFPGADACFARALALPFHSRLCEADLERVVSALTALAER
jgi:dTDP-4-amino-4,6-dideoxygalactose transaminase